MSPAYGMRHRLLRAQDFSMNRSLLYGARQQHPGWCCHATAQRSLGRLLFPSPCTQAQLTNELLQASGTQPPLQRQHDVHFHIYVMERREPAMLQPSQGRNKRGAATRRKGGWAMPRAHSNHGWRRAWINGRPILAACQSRPGSRMGAQFPAQGGGPSTAHRSRSTTTTMPKPMRPPGRSPLAGCNRPVACKAI